MGSFGAVLLVPLLVRQVCGGLAGPATKKAKNVAGPTIEWRTCRGLLGDQPRAQEGRQPPRAPCAGSWGTSLGLRRVGNLPGHLARAPGGPAAGSEGLQPPRAPVICRGLLGDQPWAQEGRQPPRAPAAGSWSTCRGRYCRTMMPEVSASTVIAEPLWMRPSRISRARRFTSSRWMRRFTGRAPKSGS